MLIADLMSPHPASCHANEPLSRAAELMWSRDCGCVPVIDDADRPIAMLTDRDVCMAACICGKPLHEIEVRTAMSATAITCVVTDDVAAAHALMREHQVHRLPVVDGDGVLAGVVSLADIVRGIAGIASEPRRTKAAAELLSTLGMVTHSRAAEPVLVLPAKQSGKKAAKKKAPPSKPARKKRPIAKAAAKNKKKSPARKKASRR